MKRKDVTFEKHFSECRNCDGTGYRDTICNEGYACDACPIEPCKNRCDTCEGTGKFLQGYIMITNGMAFYVDTIK